jgi:hypothetical protein
MIHDLPSFGSRAAGKPFTKIRRERWRQLHYDDAER